MFEMGQSQKTRFCFKAICRMWTVTFRHRRFCSANYVPGLVGGIGEKFFNFILKNKYFSKKSFFSNKSF